MVFHKDLDVGKLTLGNMRKKSPCVQFRVDKIVLSLQHVRSTQLRSFNCGLGVEDATDDSADNIHYMTTLIGEEVVVLMEKPTGTTLDFVAEVYEAWRALMQNRCIAIQWYRPHQHARPLYSTT